MRPLSVEYNIVTIPGGFCIERIHGRKREYVGQDAYWCRKPEGCAPMTEDEAECAKVQLEETNEVR